MRVMLGAGGLGLAEVTAVARRGAPVELAAQARERVRASRRVVEQALDSGTAVYGVNTGFGKLKNRSISPAQLEALQLNLLRSHAVGAGEPMPDEVVRAMGLLRAESLAWGRSGVREEVLDALLALLNRGVTPEVPEQGSVGASGDLAPLAHYALVLVGEGWARLDGERLPGGEALRRAGLEAVVLGAKEGLALINGTQQSTAYAALALADAELLLEAAVATATLSLEALNGSLVPMSARVAAVRPHPGHAWVAERVRRLAEGSEIVRAHAGCDRIQDPYSLRCLPQVVGAAYDALGFAREVVLRELAAVTDNPLVFADAPEDAPWHERILSAGNFHAQPVAVAADVAALALGSLTAIAERRIDLMLDESRGGLPAFLSPEPGLHSGMMLAQYTAAALVSENKTLAHPASVDSIPTSAGMEDHVSMAPWAARKLRRAMANALRVVAAELLVAAEAIDRRDGMAPGTGSARLHAAVRERVARLTEDRSLAADLETLARWIAAGGVGEALAGCDLGAPPWSAAAPRSQGGVR